MTFWAGANHSHKLCSHYKHIYVGIPWSYLSSCLHARANNQNFVFFFFSSLCVLVQKEKKMTVGHSTKKCHSEFTFTHFKWISTSVPNADIFERRNKNQFVVWVNRAKHLRILPTFSFTLILLYSYSNLKIELLVRYAEWDNVGTNGSQRIYLEWFVGLQLIRRMSTCCAMQN